MPQRTATHTSVGSETTSLSPRTLRVRIASFGLAAVLLVVLLITMWPHPVDAGAQDTVALVLSGLHAIGVPASFGYDELEFTANIVMFVPLGCFLGLLVDRRYWWLPLIVPVLLSAGIEMVQLAIPERVSSLLDVLANSLGGWIGALIAAGMRALLPRDERTV